MPRFKSNEIILFLYFAANPSLAASLSNIRSLKVRRPDLPISAQMTPNSAISIRLDLFQPSIYLVQLGF